MATARPGRYGTPGYQQITSLSSATALTPTSTRQTCAIVTASTNDVRWRDDGTNPTATIGQILPRGVPTWFDCNLNVLKFIDTGAGAILDVTYYEDTRAGQ